MRAAEVILEESGRGNLTRPMDKDYLILKRASMSRPSGEWSDDDFDVLAEGAVVGRIFKANAAATSQ
jgi:hypothetical protein